MGQINRASNDAWWNLAKSPGLFAGLVFLTLNVGCSWDSTSDDGTSSLGIGELVPTYRATTLTGNSFEIGPNQPLTLLNIWATWCGPCREEFPDLEGIHQELGPNGLRVLAVSVDSTAPSNVASFVQTMGVTFTIGLDPSGKIQYLYQTPGLPSSYLIGPDGRLLYSWPGRIPSTAESTIRSFLSKELAKEQGQVRTTKFEVRADPPRKDYSPPL